MLRTLLRAWCLVAILVPLAATVQASADDRPPRTRLRPADSDLTPLALTKRSNKEVVLLVSGIGSDAPDATFDRLVQVLLQDGRYEVHRFGGDPAFTYDTTGPLDENARHLAAEVRTLSATHPAVHLVTHSMGGAVADRAFSLGLSANDGVATYVALASPHNGSGMPRLAEPFLAAAGDEQLEVRAALSMPSHMDPASAAAHDLARLRAAAPPAGVVRLDLRMATDEWVLGNDAHDPGVDSRILLPRTIRGLEGHGGILQDPDAVALVTSTIAWRAIPLDRRGVADKLIAQELSEGMNLEMPLLIAVLGCACATAALCLRRHPWVRAVTRPLAQARLRELIRR